MTPSPFIIGMAGGTASGKTTLASKLALLCGSDKVAVIGLDWYYRSQDHLTLAERTLLNYDHPDSLEYELLITHLHSLQLGRSIEAPNYDYALHSRASHTTRIDTEQRRKEFIVIEVILTFANAELVKLLDLKVFVDTPEPVRFTRRLERDTRERGRSPESVHIQWQTSVQPMHREFCEPSRALADVIVDGQGDLAHTAHSLWDAVLERSRTRSVGVVGGAV
jgi:uridine kinase